MAIRYLIDKKEFTIKRIGGDNIRFYDVKGKDYEVQALSRNGPRVLKYDGDNGTASERLRVRIYRVNRQEPAFREEIGEIFVSQSELMPINFRDKLEYFTEEFYKKILSNQPAAQIQIPGNFPLF